MSNEVVSEGGLAVVPAVREEDYNLVKATVAKGATDAEFRMLVHLANKYGLDPLSREIWCVKYGSSPAAIYCGRDGFLTVAHKSGQFDGMSEGKFEKDDNGEILSCTVSVHRKDMKHPITATVYMSEYTTGRNMWKKMPHVMLLKVAESTALRKAFHVHGLYSPEEMSTKGEEAQQPQAQTTTHVEAEVVEEDAGHTALVEQLQALRSKTTEAGVARINEFLGANPSKREIADMIIKVEATLTDPA